MSVFCKFINSDNSDNSDNNNSDKCKHTCKYGEYCYKHRREYLIINNEISRSKNKPKYTT